MKTNCLLLATILICCVTRVSAEGQVPKKSTNQEPPSKQIEALIPEQHNWYKFEVSDGQKEGTIFVKIEGRIYGESILSIINLKGQEQYRTILQPIEKLQKVEIGYEGLKTGVYFVKIDSGDDIRLKKLVLYKRETTPLLVTTSTED